MGYNTDFLGELKFKKEPKASELAYLTTFLGEDAREHPEWGKDAEGLDYIDIVLTDDFNGIRWNDETEKTYGMVQAVNLIINKMREKFGEFDLEGILRAQGEDFDDRWELHIIDGQAEKKDVPITGDKIQCPHCKEYFCLGED